MVDFAFLVENRFNYDFKLLVRKGAAHRDIGRKQLTKYPGGA